MITQIDINNFGCFTDFTWSRSVKDQNGNVTNFKRLNIIYGRNYSGKTTLSRIFQGLETGNLPEKCINPRFKVKTAQGDIPQTILPAENLDVRVYNSEFIKENLSFLRDSEGNISSFAVIGSENTEIEKQIQAKELLLGSSEDNSGLYGLYATKNDDYRKIKEEHGATKSLLEDKLKAKANKPKYGIKHNPIYQDPNYNISKVKDDIQQVIKGSIEPLEVNDRNAKEDLLNEKTLPDIHQKIRFSSDLENLRQLVNKLLSKKITPTSPIQELLDDTLLQMWVEQGIPYHKDKRDTCGFCGQVLPNNLWDKLDKHFDKESKNLESDLDRLIGQLQSKTIKIDDLITFEPSVFYFAYQPSFVEKKEILRQELGKYNQVIDDLIKALEERKTDKFTIKTPYPPITIGGVIENLIVEIELLIDSNNKKTKSLSEDQAKARIELRLSEIAIFIEEIGYEKEQRKIGEMNQEVLDKEALEKEAAENISNLKNKVTELYSALSDETEGAETVNKYLNNYFGHSKLKLKAQQDNLDATYKFQVLRGSEPAFDLSEGECSLVAFCYFMAKLEDVDTKGKELIIYIDDPISSLDNNHIFFVYSLIEALIAKPVKYKQLFISTHNLEFLKYLKRLTKPDGGKGHFLVVSKEASSEIELMPSYLKNYITEFNFLFSEICICSNPDNAINKHHSFYNFGNNLRKFLESFLFFKYPSQEKNDKKIEEFFGGDIAVKPLIQRITNELSHLEEAFDRSMQPIDYDEISNLASFILSKIKESDIKQYESLLDSIDIKDPLS